MPNTLTEWLAVWVIISVIASPFIGHQLHKYKLNRDFNRELHLVLNREALLAAVRKDLANDADREWEGTPFSLDEDVQPHSDPPRAA